MPLINCPDCQHQVSTIAPACPNCGRPLKQESPLRQPHTQAIEQTSKTLKLQQILSLVLASVGVIIAWGAAFQYIHKAGRPIGVGLAVAGLVWLLVANVAAWWRHG